MEDIKKLIEVLSVENYQKIVAHIQRIKNTESNLERKLLELLQNYEMHQYYYIFFFSVLISLFPKALYLELMLEAILLCDTYTMEQQKCLLYQVEAYRFKNPLLTNDRIDELERELYKKVLDQIQDMVSLDKRDKQDRNEKNVLVMTDYFLGERHAPTHSTLERCVTLQKECGKKVWLLSIGDNISQGEVLYYEGNLPNIVLQANGLNSYNYGGEEFLLFQPSHHEPFQKRLESMLAYVEEINPYFIVYVGNRNYFADIIDKRYPVVTVATIFSKMPGGSTTFAMLGRKVTLEERKKAASELIEVPFTFELAEKKKTYRRAELGIPEDKFVLAVVGNRLDADVTDEFLTYMEAVENGFLLFLGSFSKYNQKCERFSYLVENSLALGQVSDVLGILECADLYVNPKRQGGGFSVMEAFRAGKPAISIAYGDVAAAAGEEFCVGNYEEMIENISRYQNDRTYYNLKRQQAQARVVKMTDGAKEFKNGIEQMLASDKFF